MRTIKEILMQRDGLDEEAALDLISDAQEDLQQRLSGESEDDPFSICADWFGLEEDFVMELV